MLNRKIIFKIVKFGEAKTGKAGRQLAGHWVCILTNTIREETKL